MAAPEESWKGAVSFVSERCPMLSFGDRSKIASDLWELQRAERDTLRAQRDSEVQELRAMRLAEQRTLREEQAAERQYAKIERSVLWVCVLLAVVLSVAVALAASIQASYGHRECQAQLAETRTGVSLRALEFDQGLAEIQRLTQRLAQP